MSSKYARRQHKPFRYEGPVSPRNKEYYSKETQQISTFFQEFKPRNDKQVEAHRTIDSNDLTFMLGMAGTGKTFLAVAKSMARLRAGEIDKIVAVRPAIEAGDSIGYLTGDLEAKMAPYLRPIIDAVDFFVGTEDRKNMLEDGSLEISSLTYLRGRTFNRADLIADEMQNATYAQLKMVLTRLGEGGKGVVTMDPGQCDLPNTEDSCFHDIGRFQNIEKIGFVLFANQDVVRSPIVQTVLRCYGD